LIVAFPAAPHYRQPRSSAVRRPPPCALRRAQRANRPSGPSPACLRRATL